MALGSALGLFLGPAAELVVASCHIESAFCHTSQSDQENGPPLLRRTREDDAVGRQFLCFAVSSRGFELSRLSSLLHVLNDHRGADAEFWSSFRVVVRGSASMMALSWLLLTSDGQPLHSSSRLSSPLPNFSNRYRTCTYTC